MNTSTLSSLDQLQGTARVWIYQANQPFKKEDVATIGDQLENFARKWVSHSQQLSSSAVLLHDRFVVLAVDESQAGASGCSIDSSVAFIKQLGAEYGRDMLDRMRFSYVDVAGDVQTVSKDEFADLYTNGQINDQTTVFDTLVQTIETMKSSFMKPLASSWHSRFV